MSSCQQAKAARRKAKTDKRYADKGNRDKSVMARKSARAFENMKKAGQVH